MTNVGTIHVEVLPNFFWRDHGFSCLTLSQCSPVISVGPMHGLNGFDFLKARQKLPEIAAIPTIILTSRTGSKHRHLAEELGAENYLTKPYLAPQLLGKLADLLDRSPESLLLDAQGNHHE